LEEDGLTMSFEKAFDILLGHEGGFVDHPKDPGRATRYGITQRVAQKHGYLGDMREFPLSEAKRIARAEYWDEVKADFMPDAIRFDLFDGAYNSGPVQATKWLAADPQKLAKRYNAFRLMFLTDLGTWPTFGHGWARRVAHNLLGS